MVLTHTWLDNFCGGILVPSQGLGYFGIEFLNWINTNDLSHVQDTCNMEDFISTYIPELVSSTKNMMLIKCPNFLEIKNVVFNLNGNSAPGPDGFGGLFYHSCWDIIGTDVCNAVQ